MKKNTTIVQRYGIRKFTVGAASIVIGGLMFLGMAPDAHAAEEVAEVSGEVQPTPVEADVVKTTDVQGITQHSDVKFHPQTSEEPADDAVPPKITLSLVDEEGSALPLTEGKYVDKVEGKYYVDNDFREVLFEPQPQFVGTAKGVYVELTNEKGEKSHTQYIPTVEAVTPTAEPATSSAVQGQEQSGYPTFTPGHGRVPLTGSIVLLNANKEVVEDGPVDALGKNGQKVGEYFIENGDTVIFRPTDSSYTGAVQPATVQADDMNGTVVTTTYTPSIIPVISHTESVTSENIQGQPQFGTPIFHDSTIRINNEDILIPISTNVTPRLVDEKGNLLAVVGDRYDVPEIGSYEVLPDGRVTYVPDPQFIGTALTVFVERQIANGLKVTASYTPTVIEVTPTAQPANSKAVQGRVQSATPVFTPGHTEVPLKRNSFKLLSKGQEVNTVTNILGEYTIDNATGTVTFTPSDHRYAGAVPKVYVQAEDMNGTKVMTTYQPHIIPVKPTAESVTSLAYQGEVQKGQPVFHAGQAMVDGEIQKVPLDHSALPELVSEDGYGLILENNQYIVPGEGAYSIDEQGVVTFTPEPQFVGTAQGIYVERQDINGVRTKVKYTPTVLPKLPEEVTPPTEEVAPQPEAPKAEETPKLPEEVTPPTEEVAPQPEAPKEETPKLPEEVTPPTEEVAPQPEEPKEETPKLPEEVTPPTEEVAPQPEAPKEETPKLPEEVTPPTEEVAPQPEEPKEETPKLPEEVTPPTEEVAPQPEEPKAEETPKLPEEVTPPTEEVVPQPEEPKEETPKLPEEVTPPTEEVAPQPEEPKVEETPKLPEEVTPPTEEVAPQPEAPKEETPKLPEEVTPPTEEVAPQPEAPKEETPKLSEEVTPPTEEVAPQPEAPKEETPKLPEEVTPPTEEVAPQPEAPKEETPKLPEEVTSPTEEVAPQPETPKEETPKLPEEVTPPTEEVAPQPEAPKAEETPKLPEEVTPPTEEVVPQPEEPKEETPKLPEEVTPLTEEVAPQSKESKETMPSSVMSSTTSMMTRQNQAPLGSVVKELPMTGINSSNMATTAGIFVTLMSALGLARRKQNK